MRSHAAARPLDIDRLRKCAEMMRRGATPGEREAGKAAVARVAASAGMTSEEAVRLAGGAPRPSSRSPQPEPASAHPPYEAYARAWRRAKPQPKPEPVTVAEILAQKAADLERRKKAAARQQREDLKLYAEQQKADAIFREQQAVRDREWAEARVGRHEEGQDLE